MKVCRNITVAYRNYGQFGVVMNARNARFLKLNPVGVEVWEFVCSQAYTDTKAIIEHMLAIYDVDKERIESDVRKYIADLHAAGIVEISKGD